MLFSFNSMFPFKKVVNCFTIARPNPEPIILLVFEALKKEVNISVISFSEIPCGKGRSPAQGGALGGGPLGRS